MATEILKNSDLINPEINSEDANDENTMLNIDTGIGQVKGFLAFTSSLLGLSISLTEMHEGIKLVTSLIAMLSGILFLSCAIYDRFFRDKYKTRKRYYISSRKSSKIFNQDK